MLTKSQTDTILAALRFYQQHGMASAGEAIQDIATNMGEHRPLDERAIDELCDLLNGAPPPLRLVVHVEGGAVQSVLSERDAGTDVDVYILDYDTDGISDNALTGITQSDGSVSEAIVTVHQAEVVPISASIRLSDVFGETVAEIIDTGPGI